MEEKENSTLSDWLKVFIGTSFWLGYAPVAPGTFGALPAVANYLIIVLFTPPGAHMPLIFLSLFMWSVATVLWGPWAEKYYGKKDPCIFVIDEIAGYLMTVLAFHWLFILFYGEKMVIDAQGQPHLIALLGWTFVTNRLIDIVKVPPARQAEDIGGGWGILLDDLIAGVYAALFCHLVFFFLPGLFTWL